jgi:hypothetical protein
MQKISSYLYPNRVELLADLAGFTTEYTNVYQRTVKIYNGIDNTIEFDIKNADQKRIDLSTLNMIELNVMDMAGNGLPNSPYAVTPANQATLKGIASVTILQEDLVGLTNQYLQYSVTAVKDGKDVILYADSRFGAVGKMELVGSALPTFRDDRVFDTFAAEIDLKGVPTWHSSAIPVKFYEAVPTETLSFDIDLVGFIGSVWIEATKSSTISVESFKNSAYLRSFTATVESPATTTLTFNNISVADFNYFRVSYSTPIAMGTGASFSATLNNNAYDVTLRAGGTGYSVGSQLKVLGSVLGGIDGINDLIIVVTGVDASSAGFTSSYAVSSITHFSASGIAADGAATYIVTGKNISGTVDKIVVS